MTRNHTPAGAPGESLEAALGRKVLASIERINTERRVAKAERRAVIAAIRQSWRGVRYPTARQVRDRWVELAPDIRPPSLRSTQEHLKALRGT
jgi:hypothetical protein